MKSKFYNHNDIIRTSSRALHRPVSVTLFGDNRTVKYRVTFERLYSLIDYRQASKFEYLVEMLKGKDTEITLDEVAQLCKLEPPKIRYIVESAVMNPVLAHRFVADAIGDKNK